MDGELAKRIASALPLMAGIDDDELRERVLGALHLALHWAAAASAGDVRRRLGDVFQALMTSPSVASVERLELLAAAANACFDDPGLAPDSSPIVVAKAPLVAQRQRPRAHLLIDARFVAPGIVDEPEEPLEMEPEPEPPPSFDPTRGFPVDEAATQALAALDQGAAAGITAARSAGFDEELADFDAALANGLTVLPDVGQPIDVAVFRGRVVDDCLETISALARDRAVAPMRSRAASEERMLALVDAILAIGGSAIDPIVAGFVGSFDREPWMAFGPLFALGSIEGPVSLSALLHCVGRLDPHDLSRGRIVMEALATAPHADLSRLAATLAQSKNPMARAVGLDLHARRKGIDLEQVRHALGDPNPAVLHTAIRVLERATESDARIVDLLRDLVWFPDPDVSFAAARMLLLWGDGSPYALVREGASLPLFDVPVFLEIFVMAGQEDDLGHMQQWVSRLVPSPYQLDALARFGHPRAWGYLMHFLGDEDLAEAADRALGVLFGRPADEAEGPVAPGAWRGYIARAKLEETCRYRGGRPWDVGALLEPCLSGELSRVQVLRAMDELRVRTGTIEPFELAAWSPMPESQLSAFAERLLAAKPPPAGRWL
jgi:hypothetical protein